MSNSITVRELLDERFNKANRRMNTPLRVYEICAEDFLKFAIEDAKGRNLRSRVNALGNVKRAIECRIDSLLYNYCLHKKVKKQDGTFLKRLRLFSK